MALERPKFNVPSASESAQFVSADDKFLSIRDGETVMLRFLPAPGDAPSIFFPVANHHGLVNQDKKKVAMGCLATHGNEATGVKCLLCEAVRYLYDLKTEANDKLAKDLKATPRFYTQVLQGLFRTVNGKPTLQGWTRPKLIQWSGKIQGKFATIMAAMEKMGEPLFYHPFEGQALSVTRDGEGFKTDYLPERTGVKVSLDDIRPTWQDEFIDDMYEAVGLNVGNRELQLAYLRISYPAIDWTEVLGVEEAE